MMTMSCPEVMYPAYYPYLYQRGGAAVPRPTFPSPFAHQLDRLNVQRSFQEHLSSDGPTYSGQHGLSQHSQQSSAASVASSGPCGSPGSPVIRHKEENLRGSTDGTCAEDGVSDDEASCSSRAQYLSANCVVFTHYTGDVAAVVDEHFSRALSYSDKNSPTPKETISPMSSRNFPPSFWNINYQSPPVSVGHHGELYGDYQHASTDPWHSHYQQYTAAAAHHHHRAVHEYHHHHNTVAQYSGLLLPRGSLPPQYAKEAWPSAAHSSRLHDSPHAHAHFESTYPTYPSMSVVGDAEKEMGRGPGMGRITGSASIETLVRVGIEKENGLSPESKMVVLHDFTPCVDDELHVKRGQIVNILYRENDWVYVIAEDTRQEGFIPHTYCTPYGTGNLKMPRDPDPPLDSDGEEYGGAGPSKNRQTSHNNNNVNLTSSQGSLHSAGSSSQPDVHPFSKDPSGRYIVLYTFIARDENDVSVERGEFVTVLNREDPDWFWIVRSDGQEGFVPSGFVYPADVVQGHIRQGLDLNPTGNTTIQTQYSNSTHLPQQASEDMKYHGTELVMLYDYKAQAPDDLSVRRGDWIYADLPNQTVDGWLWAYAPKTRKYGFIPKAYARPPAMTCL